MSTIIPRPQKPHFSGMYTHPFDVVEAAKKRIRWCLDNFDDIVVSFSGGKDSLVMLELCDQVYKERGIKEKLKVKFMDEELVSDHVIRFVQSIAESGRFNFRWYALRMKVGFFVMGVHKPFISWDPTRPWHRQPPPYAITDIGVDTSHMNENHIGELMYPDTTKKVCVMVGIRAQESMKRLHAISKNGRRPGQMPNHMSRDTPDGNVWTGKPIYDMTETDVFKFFKEYNVPYAACYDAQLYSRSILRVSSAMHERAANQFFKLKQIEPEFYHALRAVYPEIEAHYRYWNEVDRFKVMSEFPPTFDGVRQYIDKYIEPQNRAEAHRYVTGCESARRNNLKREPTLVLGYMPVRQIFQIVVAGRFAKGAVLRFNVCPEDVAFEEAPHGV